MSDEVEVEVTIAIADDECHSRSISISIGKHPLLIGLEFVRERRTVRTQIAPLLLRAPLVCAGDQSAWLNATAPLTRDAWNAMLSPDGKVYKSQLLLDSMLHQFRVALPLDALS